MMNKFSFKNPFNKMVETWNTDAKANTNEHTEKQAVKLFADKPFTEEHRTAYLLSIGLKWLSALVSFVSGCFAAYYVFSFVFGAILAAGIGFVCCLLIELLKNSLWGTTSKSWLKYRSFAVAGVLSLFALHSLSFGASVFGARCAADYLPMVAAGGGDTLINTKTVTKPYDNQITAIDNQTAILLTEKPSKTTGKFSGTTKGIIKQLNKQRDSLQTAKKTAIAAIKKQNDATTQLNKKSSLEQEKAHKDKQQFYSMAAAITAGVFELIFILTQLFIIKYLFRAYIDSSRVSQPNEKSTHTDVTAHVTNNVTPPSQRSPIGFKMPTNKKIGVGGVAECKCCSAEFVKNAHNQKYCSDTCRIEYWERSNGKKLVTGK